MRTASVTELKARLAQYLRLARRGSEVQILERGVPIARLVMCPAPSGRSDRERLERLVREGTVRRGAANLNWVLVEPPLVAPKAELSLAVEAERSDRL